MFVNNLSFSYIRYHTAPVADLEGQYQHQVDGGGELCHQGEDGLPHPQREVSLHGVLQHVRLRLQGW